MDVSPRDSNYSSGMMNEGRDKKRRGPAVTANHQQSPCFFCFFFGIPKSSGIGNFIALFLEFIWREFVCMDSRVAVLWAQGLTWLFCRWCCPLGSQRTNPVLGFTTAVAKLRISVSEFRITPLVGFPAKANITDITFVWSQTLVFLYRSPQGGFLTRA